MAGRPDLRDYSVGELGHFDDRQTEAEYLAWIVPLHPGEA